MKSKTIAIIPARGGSKDCLIKNRLLLGDYPLLVHSIFYAQANKTSLMRFMFQLMIQQSKQLLWLWSPSD
jgi:hypothetical protein